MLSLCKAYARLPLEPGPCIWLVARFNQPCLGAGLGLQRAAMRHRLSTSHTSHQHTRVNLLPFWRNRECLQPPCQGVYKPIASPICERTGLLDPEWLAILMTAQSAALVLEACLAAGGDGPIKASINEVTQACVPDAKLLMTA